MYKYKEMNLCHKRGGLTIIEVIVAVAIFAGISLVMGLFMRDLFVINTSTQNSLSAQQDARVMMKEFSAELRSSLSSGNGSYSLEITGGNEIIFYSDVDSDGAVERVRYYLSGTDIKKDIIEPTGSPVVYTSAPKTKTMVRDVANGGAPIFTYYDSSYDGTSPPLSTPVSIPKVRLVKADVIIERDPNRSPTPVIVTTQVAIRNLKDNL